MWKPILLLVPVLALLVWWDLALSSSEVERREAGVRIGRLVEPETRERIQAEFQVLAVERGPARWYYAPSPRGWVCINHFGAPADGAAIDRLYAALLEAEGEIRTEDPARAAQYGLGPDEAWRLAFLGEGQLHGEGLELSFDGAPILELELGHEVAGRDGCYARHRDRDPIWAVDTNPVGILGTAEGPPLLDPRVVPASWPGGSRRLNRVDVQHPDQAFEVLLEMRELTPEEVQRGERPFEWVLAQGGTRHPAAHPILPVAFVSYLLEAPWEEVVDPRQAASLQTPRAELMLSPPEGQGEPLVLRLGAPLPDGSVLVGNLTSGCALRLTAEHARLLAPRIEELLETASENPWEDYLRSRR